MGERKKMNSAHLQGDVRSHLDGICVATAKVAVPTTTAPDLGPSFPFLQVPTNINTLVRLARHHHLPHRTSISVHPSPPAPATTVHSSGTHWRTQWVARVCRGIP